jgi:hypothetical protein
LHWRALLHCIERIDIGPRRLIVERRRDAERLGGEKSVVLPVVGEGNPRVFDRRGIT